MCYRIFAIMGGCFVYIFVLPFCPNSSYNWLDHNNRCRGALFLQFFYRIFTNIQVYCLTYIANQYLLKIAKKPSIDNCFLLRRRRTFTLTERFTLSETFRILRIFNRVHIGFAVCIIPAVTIMLILIVQTLVVRDLAREVRVQTRAKCCNCEYN